MDWSFWKYKKNGKLLLAKMSWLAQRLYRININNTLEVLQWKIVNRPIGGVFDTIHILIQPGEGGKDSQLFAQDLCGVYEKHAKRYGLEPRLVSSTTKQIQLEVSGANPWRVFQYEAGIHRVQRVPTTEKSGRVHTSIINVMVLKEKPREDIKIDRNNVVISYYKDSGAGGQHRNKTMSGVRLQYEGITVECCETRDQKKNKELAFQRLEEKLQERQNSAFQRQRREEISAQNPNYGKRGNFLRNYNYMRDEVLQDDQKYKLSHFLRGNLERLYGRVA